MPKKKTGNPIAPFKTRKFACARWPFLRIGGGLQFDNGHLTIESNDAMERLERTDAYRVGHIVEIKERGRASEEHSVEETAVLTALDELKKLQPRVNKGAVSTRTMVG